MSGGVIALLLIAALIIVAITVMQSAADRERSQALEDWARGRGWRYDRERPEMVGLFRGSPFKDGSSDARVRHVISGEHRGHRFLAYEYSYTSTLTTAQGSLTANERYGVVVVGTRATPILEVRRTHPGHVLLAAAGVRDIEVGDRDFDDVFHVAGDDEEFAACTLTPRVREHLLERPSLRSPFRLTGDHLVSWRRGRLGATVALETIEASIDLLELLPDRIREESRD